MKELEKIIMQQDKIIHRMEALYEILILEANLCAEHQAQIRKALSYKDEVK